MLLEGVSLCEQVSVVCAVLALSDSQTLHVSPHGEQGVFTLLKAHLRVTNLDRNVSIATFLEVNLLS